MKTLPRYFALVTLSTFAFAPTLLRAQDAPPPPDQGAPPPDFQGAAPQDQGGDQDDQGASFQTFYDQLGDQGQWVQTDDYGYVFQPNVSDPNWAPYTDGHWVYTDEGWTWVSDEPWGWATYHYGRWCNIDGTGWCWVPGYRWAPAWVSWRYGGGYAGWAPLPPETFVGAEYGTGIAVGVGFHFGNDVDVHFNIGPGCYNFVRVDDLGERNYRGRYIDRSRNYTVINNTTNITNINVNRGGFDNSRGGNFRGVSTGGPRLADVNAHSREHVQTVQLTSANQAGRSTLNGNSLAVFAPHMNPGSQHTSRPTRVGQTVNHPTFNRGDSIEQPLAVTAAVKPAAPSAEAITAAREAHQHAPAQAHIATGNTVSTPMTTPLTSMQPVEQQHHHQGTATTPGATTTAPHTENAASAPFTGEAPKSAAVAQPQTEVAPHSDSSAFTGERQNPAPVVHPQTHEQPAQAFHPQTETAPAQVIHPQQQVEQPAPVVHPQTEAAPAQTYHPQTHEHEQPAQTFHQHTETQGSGGQANHSQDEFRPSQQPATPSAPSYHPQAQANPAPAYHPQAQASPAPSYHPQAVEHPAPVFHPQSVQQHESASAQTHAAAPAQTHSQPAAPAATHTASPAAPAAAQGGNKSGTANPQGH